jgi:23S rRNA pseudouridine2605 synthase
MHKPVGIVTTRDDERGRRTVYDLLPPAAPWVAPVGRLDRDSSGLLLLTNDSRLAAAIGSPETGLAKRYSVTLDVPLPPGAIARFAAGSTLADGTALRPAFVEVRDATGRELVVTLHEGRNRQIRRMAADCGCTVVRLHRDAIGPIAIGELPPGAVRRLIQTEVAALTTALRNRRD